MTWRAAVVGAGHLGRHHARIYANLPGVQLVAVCDTDLARAREVAAPLGARAVADLRGLPDGLDGASVAVPTAAHHEVASRLLERGLHLLVEKPMCATSREAESLAAMARDRRVHLQPGFVERFNPAIRAAAGWLRRPRYVEALRVAPLQFRSLDIGVVMDLMIHDLDIVLWLAGGEPVSAAAVGVRVLTASEDMASARLVFPNGCVAQLTASRVAMKTVREIRVFQEDAYLAIDYAERRLRSVRKRAEAPRDPEALRALLSSGEHPLALMGRFLDVREEALSEEEPLAAEIAAFVAAARGEAPPVLTGADGVAALRAAERIREAMQAP